MGELQERRDSTGLGAQIRQTRIERQERRVSISPMWFPIVELKSDAAVSKGLRIQFWDRGKTVPMVLIGYLSPKWSAALKASLTSVPNP
jgi:hypothetical protein